MTGAGSTAPRRAREDPAGAPAGSIFSSPGDVSMFSSPRTCRCSPERPDIHSPVEVLLRARQTRSREKLIRVSRRPGPQPASPRGPAGSRCRWPETPWATAGAPRRSPRAPVPLVARWRRVRTMDAAAWASKPEVGSSRTKASGPVTSSMATDTRRRSPPLTQPVPRKTLPGWSDDVFRHSPTLFVSDMCPTLSSSRRLDPADSRSVCTSRRRLETSRRIPPGSSRCAERWIVRRCPHPRRCRRPRPLANPPRTRAKAREGRRAPWRAYRS